jgi:hypothetical protein
MTRPLAIACFALLAVLTASQAMLVMPAQESSLPAGCACPDSSETHYASIIDSDCGAQKTCRNNPIDGTDPTGLTDKNSVAMNLCYVDINNNKVTFRMRTCCPVNIRIKRKMFP